MKKEIVYVLIVFISIFFISCTNVEKLGKNVENSNDLESYLYENNVIKTSEYYTKDVFLVFKNYFEDGNLVKQEIFDKEGNIEYTFEIKNDKISSIKNSKGQKIPANKIYYYNNISHTKELFLPNKIFTFEDYLNNIKDKGFYKSLYDELDPGQYTFGYKIETVEAGPTIGQISSTVFLSAVEYLIPIATNKLISTLVNKLKPIKDLIQYGSDFYSYIKSNFQIEKEEKFQEWRREQKKIWVQHYISDENGKWVKSWDKVFAIAEMHFANVILKMNGRTYYKYYNYGVYETRSEPAFVREIKRNVEEVESPNYGSNNTLLSIAKENYFTYLNSGKYNIWYETP